MQVQGQISQNTEHFVLEVNSDPGLVNQGIIRPHRR